MAGALCIYRRFPSEADPAFARSRRACCGDVRGWTRRLETEGPRDALAAARGGYDRRVARGSRRRRAVRLAGRSTVLVHAPLGLAKTPPIRTRGRIYGGWVEDRARRDTGRRFDRTGRNVHAPVLAAEMPAAKNASSISMTSGPHEISRNRVVPRNGMLQTVGFAPYDVAEARPLGILKRRDLPRSRGSGSTLLTVVAARLRASCTATQRYARKTKKRARMSGRSRARHSRFRRSVTGCPQRARRAGARCVLFRGYRPRRAFRLRLSACRTRRWSSGLARSCARPARARL